MVQWWQRHEHERLFRFAGRPPHQQWYFDFAGFYGYLWSSSLSGSLARGRILYYDSESLSPSGFDKRIGYSVRCVRDAE